MRGLVDTRQATYSAITASEKVVTVQEGQKNGSPNVSKSGVEGGWNRVDSERTNLIENGFLSG